VKLPPVVDRPVVLPARRQAGQSQLRLLVVASVLLVAIAMLLKSEAASHLQAWMVGVAMVLVAGPALLRYLAHDGRLDLAASLEHLVPCILGALAAAGLSLLVVEWWKYALIALGLGIGYFFLARLDCQQLRSKQRLGHVVIQWGVLAIALSTSYLVIVALQFPLPVRLAGIFLTSFLATYRSFRVLGKPMIASKALYHSVFVSQLVFFFAWGMSYWVYFTDGVFSVLLFLLWYVNTGLIRHLEERSFNRNVAIEYALFGLLLAYLFVHSFQTH
jgi:hypothetical protein